MKDYVNNELGNENKDSSIYGIILSFLAVFMVLLVVIKTMFNDYRVYMSSSTMECSYIEVVENDSWVKRDCPEVLPKKYETIWIK